ncbi:MAG: phosphoglycolate phosphatase [Aeropyrum sp.]|nr:phosphoglycolate phosphatase [Aeropyrum sp.]MCE4615788.1 phosphoglycolate phosphatase [Aeropyrum sp.]
MSGVRVVALDVDGTITARRGDTRLDPCSIKIARVLDDLSVEPVLVTGNSLPVVKGLASYLGLRGPVIAENGCVAFVGGERIHFCRGKPPKNLVESIVELGFVESWQNEYRYHEYALIPVAPDKPLIRRASSLARQAGYSAIWSGYALHIQPPGGGKARGLEALLEMLGASWSEVLAVGDGDNDVEMLAKAGISGAPADASNQAKTAASIVASRPGASGTFEIISRVFNLPIEPC